MKNIRPYPIFDTYEHLPDPFAGTVDLPAHLLGLENLSQFKDDYWMALRFICSYEGSVATMNAYRRELERLIQWSWYVLGRRITELRREHIEQFIQFCQSPPPHWIGVKTRPRFLERDGQRVVNPEWRPFVASLSKIQRRNGQNPDPKHYQMSQSGLKSLFAILSSFFQFLIQEERISANPVALIRQKSKYLVSSQQGRQVRRISNMQWDFVLETARELASKEPERHERTLFIMSCLFSMYLRISELAADDRHIPRMADFSKDQDGNWWFEVIGKGNKSRSISVSDAMLTALKRYRHALGLTPLPFPGDPTPLLTNLGGNKPITSTRHIRQIVQFCFDQAVSEMAAKGLADESYELQAATVHWLRHTGISEDVKSRPIEHVRDDAGHASSITTDRYVDAERRARHASAKNKPLGSHDQ